ncbi:4943_t:CDS:2 [Ambispora gerdemannii]|uniref:4943_t:CDS:1 n=1 Tax=Ambispora gerdemannii TaxID=144530 RepID=A0A9N9BA60_9GLOM|nr:4943_t:CDS:2 [Ambispora gerdemannii]
MKRLGIGTRTQGEVWVRRVLVYEQKVIKYGSEEYINQQLSDLDDKMSGDHYLTVDPLLREHFILKFPQRRQCMLSAPMMENIVYHGSQYPLMYRTPPFVTNRLESKLKELERGESSVTLGNHITLYRHKLGKKGWRMGQDTAPVYGAPAKLYLISDPFSMSIGDDNNWSN